VTAHHKSLLLSIACPFPSLPLLLIKRESVSEPYQNAFIHPPPYQNSSWLQNHQLAASTASRLLASAPKLSLHLLLALTGSLNFAPESN
jgi:hypothetical protein